MSNLNTLLTLTQRAVALTHHQHTWSFPMQTPTGTVYLHAHKVGVRVVRWEQPSVQATIDVTPPFGWRFGAEYDADGVYVVLLQRAVLQGLVKGTLNLIVPHDAHLVLRLQDCLLTLDQVNGTLELPPMATAGDAYLPSSSR